MFNRKQYILTLVVIGVLTIGTGVVIFIMDLDWLYLLVVMMMGYLYLKYKLTTPLQHFSNKFNLMVDYDLDLEGAMQLCQDHYDQAPTQGLKGIYRWYLGMAMYYSGRYDEALRTLNQVELRRMNPVYQVLIFVFQAYSAYELQDREQFAQMIQRIEDIRPRIHRKYQNFVASYLEILTAMRDKEQLSDQFKDVVERHFNRNDGYISTKLIYQYRMSEYYEVVGDLEAMEKALAFVIANGKNHHLALLAQKKFKGTVALEDYIYHPEAEQVQEDLPIDVEPIQQITHEERDEEDKEE